MNFCYYNKKNYRGMRQRNLPKNLRNVNENYKKAGSCRYQQFILESSAASVAVN